MGDHKDNFRSAVERTIWSYSNLSVEDRAAVLREFAEELEDGERFEDKKEHIRERMREMNGGK